jgi:N4-(beta-N-acetylglucosaminyl)-L-asparaginase
MSMARREFMKATGGAAAAGALGVRGMGGQRQPEVEAGDAHRGACVISSGNGERAVARAMELIRGGGHPLDAIVEGIKIVEDDPNDMSVGYGGLPNEEGVVQLDASVMDGLLHRAGAVAALENIKNPAAVALLVSRRTDHVMLVGAGALKFAKKMGFKEEDLLTDAAREAWVKWRANLGKDDDWLNDDERDAAEPGKKTGMRSSPHRVEGGPVVPDSTKRVTGAPDGVPFTWGTIHCSAVTEDGHVAACTSTSGLSWKLPGRVGDSPIVGAGMYCDNAVGSAGATGRGEAVIQVCGAFSIVQHMESGKTPGEACLTVAKRIADHTREKRLLDEKGRPKFNVTLYAVRKDGAYGSASLWKGSRFAVSDGAGTRVVDSGHLFEKA